jgi:hypothetical protein
LYTLILRPSNRPQKYELKTEGLQLCHCRKERALKHKINELDSVCVDRDEESTAIHCLEQWLSTGGARHGVGYGVTNSHKHCVPLDANLITFMIYDTVFHGLVFRTDQKKIGVSPQIRTESSPQTQILMLEYLA